MLHIVKVSYKNRHPLPEKSEVQQIRMVDIGHGQNA